MDRETIISGLEVAVELLHRNHTDLFERGVREEALTFHFAGYLMTEFDMDERELSLDIEYNKKIDSNKDFERREDVLQEIEEELEGFGLGEAEISFEDITNNVRADIQPDLVIHDRGTQDSNVFVSEIKKRWEDRTKKDAAKLLYLTHPQTDYCYQYGALIPVEPESLQSNGAIWVEDGEVESKFALL